MLIELIILLMLFLCYMHISIRFSRTAKYLDKIPGPPGWPIVGNLFKYVVPPDKLWHMLQKQDKEYYPLYKVWILKHSMVVILDPINAETLLKSTQHITKGLTYEYFHCWFGTGLLTSTGLKWQERRKILTSAFHFNILQKYFDIIVENEEKTIEKLRAKGESVQNLLPMIANFTLNVICETAMGTVLQGKENEQEKYRKAVHDMGNTFMYRIVRPWLMKDWIFGLTPVGRKQKRDLKILHDFSKNIIKERKEYHEKTKGRFLKNLEVNDELEEKETIGYRKKRLAMLDLLIAAEKEQYIDEPGIQEEVDTFIFEGHDTSAMGLCFALLLIAEHKDIQERIRKEVNEVLENSEGKIGQSELQRMTYLERCIKESLRLYPSVPIITRYLEQDLQLKDYLIPEGTIVELRIQQIHKDPNHWPDPNKFDPDRFLPERSKGRHPYAYIPFSAGLRNCIGQKFALMELKIFIAQIVHNFFLEPIDLAHEVPCLIDLVLRPARPLHVKFIPIVKK